ncbi:MAG: thermonuclease family protein [Patescibacteria group bacterium]
MWFRFLLIPLSIISLILNLYLGYRVLSNNNKNVIKVLSVYDGDTLILENKTRLRLRHLDAPELKYCGGQEAKTLLESLIKDSKISVEEQISDQKGRMMGLVYSGGAMINEKLISSGLVRYHSDKTSKTALLKTLAMKAKTYRKGIFSDKCQSVTNLDNPKCIIKGNLENKRVSGRSLYYLPTCAQYKFVQVEKDLGEQWFCTEKEASLAGYLKPATCK